MFGWHNHQKKSNPGLKRENIRIKSCWREQRKIITCWSSPALRRGWRGRREAGGGHISLHDSCKLDIWSAPQTAHSALPTFPFFIIPGPVERILWVVIFALLTLRNAVKSEAHQETDNQTLTQPWQSLNLIQVLSVSQDHNPELDNSFQSHSLPTNSSYVSPNECFNTPAPGSSFCWASAKKVGQKTHFHLIVGGVNN